MIEATFQTRLPCGGSLRIFERNWDIHYYFPGPDRRYNGTSLSIPGDKIEQYIVAYEENFLEYEQLKQTIPEGGEFSKLVKMGMSIRIGLVRQGVCLHSYHMPVSTREQLNSLLDGYRDANRQVIEFRKALFPPAAEGSTTVTAVSLSLEERWERSRAEAKAVTEAKAALAGQAAGAQGKDRFDPYASQRHKRGRKSHLAAAINQNIHDHPAMGCIWFVIFAVLIVGSFILGCFK